ncbi:Prokaryotic homologs of the JAB domain protein [uncultured archaeon]|nr:Prokaryotic homologs of the JAB domain protein [uncultured archaeon]
MPKVSKTLVVTVKQGVLDPIIEACRNSGREQCGVLAGTGGFISYATLVDNIAINPDAFDMDPVGLSKALDHLDELNLEIIAFFHSHRGESAQPSPVDLVNIKDVPMMIISSKEVKMWKPDYNTTTPVYREMPFLMNMPKSPLLNKDDGFTVTIRLSNEAMKAIPSIMDAFFRRGEPRMEDRLRDLSQLTAMIGAVQGRPQGQEILQALQQNLVGGVLGQGVCMNRPSEDLTITSTPPQPRPVVPEHIHHYAWSHKTPDGKNIWECSTEGCNAMITINGEIGPKPDQLSKEGGPVIDVEVTKDDSKEKPGDTGGDGPVTETGLSSGGQDRTGLGQGPEGQDRPL